MHLPVSLRSLLLLALIVAVSSCSGAGSSSMTSPSGPTSVSAGSGTFHPTDDVPLPVQPGLQPGLVPPAPGTIDIVGPSGILAFNPNPNQTVLGTTITWHNVDVLPHYIVLDDGTEAGVINPGESTMPLTLMRDGPVTYHCIYHPSMVGVINGDISMAVPPAPPAGGGDPGYPPSPAPGYDYGYRVR